ncbi:MAG: protealysin inhibitor emfourin [Planctomycetota bacterium]
MKITFLESGGFAGTLRGVRIDAGCLPAPERAELERLVAGCGVERSCECFAKAARDRRQYDLAIDRRGRVVRLSCDDASVPRAARPLIEFLAARASPQAADFDLPAATDHDAEPPRGLRAAADDAEAMAADGAWGRFEGDVVARWEDDGRRMTLVEPFAYVDPRGGRWKADAGLVVDGASIPRAFWSFIGGPFAGEFRNASVVHDAACADRDRSWRAAHRMFYEACRCGGVGAVKAKTMYYAVFHFGPRWHIEERTTIVAGRPQVEAVIRDDTPTPPSDAEAAAVIDYFATHEVAAEDIPTLEIPGGHG